MSVENDLPKVAEKSIVLGSTNYRKRFTLRLSEGKKMRVKLRFIVVIALIMVFSAAPVLSDEAMKIADGLLEQRHYDQAITEYKRFVFFNPEDEQISYAFYKMGLAYRAGRNWQPAIDAFKSSVRRAGHASIANERRLVLATTLIASGNYSLARLELLRVIEFSGEASLRAKARYFDGIASLYMFDWDAVERAFGDFYSESSEGRMVERVGQINPVLLEARRSYRSVGLARFLSTLLPGLGQIYAGDWRDGLNALAINGLGIGLLANAIYHEDYTDAVLISSISMRYYMGNRYRAGVDVRKHNESMDRQNAVKILHLVGRDEP